MHLNELRRNLVYSNVTNSLQGRSELPPETGETNAIGIQTPFYQPVY